MIERLLAGICAARSRLRPRDIRRTCAGVFWCAFVAASGVLLACAIAYIILAWFFWAFLGR